MNEKFNKNSKVEKFTTMLGIAVRLVVIDPLKIYNLSIREVFPWVLSYVIAPYCPSTTNNTHKHFNQGYTKVLYMYLQFHMNLILCVKVSYNQVNY